MLDAGLRVHLQIEVKKLQRKLGVTTIFVTHDQHEAMSIADRIVILNSGVIEQAGAPTEVYASPASEFVANFMGTNNVIEVDLTRGQVVRFNDVSLGAAPAAMHTLAGSHKLSVRPEYRRLAPVRSDEKEPVGKVDFVRLLGASIETQLGVGDQTFIHTMVSDRAPELKVGDHAAISFDLDHAWVIPS